MSEIDAFRLDYRAPFAWEAHLDFLAPRAIPDVEAVEDGAYLRTFRATTGELGWLVVRCAPELACLRVRVHLATADPGSRSSDSGEGRGPRLRERKTPRSAVGAFVAARLSEVFDLEADAAAIDRVLATAPELAGHVARIPGVRVPGAFDGFETAVRAILGQQISVKGATTIAGRIASRWGEALGPGVESVAATATAPPIAQVFPTAGALVDVPLEDVGLTRARADTIRGLARAVLDEPALLDRPPSLARGVERWQALKGIGPWTAHYVAMRVLRAADALPTGDLGLRKAITKKSTKPRPAGDVEKVLEGCRPYRAYAAMRLWAQLGEG